MGAAAVEPGGQPPVGLAGQEHEGGDEDATDDDGVEEGGGGEADTDAEEHDHPFATEHEAPKTKTMIAAAAVLDGARPAGSR